MKMLENKVALVTGSGRGIGRAIALAFARAGADVALISRTRTELDVVAGEVHQLGRRAMPVIADVADPDDVNRMVADTLAGLGQIDILVNNAAVAGPKPVIDLSLEEWNRFINVNLTGVFLCSRAVLSHMIDRRQGNIISIASGSGFRGAPGNAAYSAAKAGVVIFTYSLAGEVRDLGIRANVISPGPIRTQMLADRPASADDSIVLEPEDVAGAALYLASDLSGHITAQTIHVRNASRW